MAYPFSQNCLFDESRKKALAELAESAGDVFDKDFPDRLPDLNALDLDGFAEGPLKKYTGETLATSDTLVIDEDGVYWFVEFKNQRLSNGDGPRIQRKAVESLLVACMTSAQQKTLRELMRKSVFVVVFPEQDYSTMLGKALARDAYGSDAVLWRLDKLVKAEILHAAHTVTDREFRQLGPFKSSSQP